MEFACPDCEVLHWLGERHSDSSKLHPKFHCCCKSNAVQLPAICNPSAELRELFTSMSQDAVQFHKYICHYNEVFAFTSANYKTDCRVQGFSPFQIHGELYHLQGLLEANDGAAPQFAQVWIHDPQYGTEICCG